MNHQAAIKRELPASRHIPYTAHVAPEVVVTSAGDHAQTLRLSGASFESADDETLNNWHERLNVTWRNIASPNVALWAHLVPAARCPPRDSNWGSDSQTGWRGISHTNLGGPCASR
jgi:type IV secretory pathway VirB4 component